MNHPILNMHYSNMGELTERNKNIFYSIISVAGVYLLYKIFSGPTKAVISTVKETKRASKLKKSLDPNKTIIFYYQDGKKKSDTLKTLIKKMKKLRLEGSTILMGEDGEYVIFEGPMSDIVISEKDMGSDYLTYYEFIADELGW